MPKKNIAAKKMSDAIPVNEKRHFIRHPLCFPLSYKIIDKNSSADDKGKKSTTINISMGGLLFSAKLPVETGSVILLNMPFQDKIFNIKAQVEHCTKNPETKLYNIGVCFSRLSDAFKTKLIEQLYLISEFRDLRSMQLGREVSLEEASREWIKKYSERFRRLYW